jgi:deoxyribonuclease V
MGESSPIERAAHGWNLSVDEAIALQDRLRRAVVAEDALGPVRSVAGIDAGYEEDGQVVCAAVAVLSYPDLALQTYAIARRPVTFPYVPGLLSFRESPAVLEALARLSASPDLLLYDGHGYAHPRRFGIACHVGVLTGIPTIGVAKSLLVGRHAPLEPERGARQPLLDGNEVVGVALRTRAATRPVYVSIGHRVSLASAVYYVLRCASRFRLPEPARWAHRLAGQGW